MARFDLSKGGIRTSKKSAAGAERADKDARQTVADGQAKSNGSVAPKDGNDKPIGSSAPEGAAASNELSMSVSGICGEPGNLYAFVRFEDQGRYCEYRFPDVALKVNDGFSEEELVQLKFYVASHVSELKKMAAAIDPIHAMLS